MLLGLQPLTTTAYPLRVLPAKPNFKTKTAGGTPQGRQTGVAFSLVTFFLAKQKKVTSCRATPGEVDFDVGLLDSRRRGNDARYAFPIPFVGNPICFAKSSIR